MKNEIFSIEINENALYPLAKVFYPNIKKTDLYLIYLVKDQVEENLMNHVSLIFEKLKNQNNDISFKVFKNELDKEL